MQTPLPAQATNTMRAVVSRRYGSVDTIRIEHVAIPVPGADEILVRNHATVVTAAMSEVRAGASLMPRLHFGLMKPKWPILGTNFAGEVAAIGSAVSKFAVGERVAGANMANFGASAEYIVVSENGAIISTPDSLTDEEAVALFDGSLTALPFLRDAAHLREGQSVLINGAAGGIGSAAVQIARHLGAVVTAVCSTENLDLVTSLGADRVMDRTRSDFTAQLNAFDVIFDTVGKSSFLQCERALKSNGLYMTTVPTPAILLQKFWSSRHAGKKATILFTGLYDASAVTEDLLAVAELARQGALAPTIGSVTSMDGAASVYGLVGSGRKVGSAVIALR